jgi:hypothetical protein
MLSKLVIFKMHRKGIENLNRNVINTIEITSNVQSNYENKSEYEKHFIEIKKIHYLDDIK